MKKIFLVAVVFGLFSCKNNTQLVKKDKTPNILLIVVDDQGYADFAPFKNHDVTAETPNMAKLAATGTVYTEAYTTAPVCSPSRAGMLTGKNQIRWDTKASWGPGLPDNVKTIPEYLKQVGYATARIGKNDLGKNFHKYDVREYPTKHGYDEFLGFSAHAHDYWLLSQEMKDRTPDPNGTSAVLGPLMHNDGVKSYDDGYLTDILTNEAIDYIHKSKNKPFYLTLAYNSVHHLIHEVPQKYLDKYKVKPIPNYNPDDKMDFEKHKPGTYGAYYDKYSRLGAIQDEVLRKYYLANINCLDDNIGKVLDALKKEGIDKNTLIIFISDNGGTPLNGANNNPLTAGKYSLWEGGIRVPMAISWPGKIPAGKTQHGYVSAMDILPTIVGAAGVSITDTTLDGQSLLKPPVKDRVLVWKWQKTWAIRIGDWKLTNTDEDHWKSRPSNLYIAPIRNDLSLKLFDVKNDPGERKDLSLVNTEKVKELETAYNEWCTANIGKY